MVRRLFSSEIAFVLLFTLILAYVPYFLSKASGGDPSVQTGIEGGLYGFFFSIFLAASTRVYRSLKSDFDELARKVDAQGKAYKINEEVLKAQTGDYAKLFGKLADNRVERLHGDLKSLRNDPPFYIVEQQNPAKEYVDIFVNLMRTIIPENSDFRVVSNMSVWDSGNFGGADQRYILANKRAARERGINITRIFVVRSPSLFLARYKELGQGRVKEDLEQYISQLREHMEIFEQHVEEEAPGGGGGRAERKNKGKVILKVDEMETEEAYRDHFEGSSDNFALWSVSEDSQVCTQVNYKLETGDRYSIKSIRFSAEPKLVWEKENIFEHKLKNARSLKAYIEELEQCVEKCEETTDVG